MKKINAYLRYFCSHCVLISLLMFTSSAWAQELVVVQSNVSAMPVGAMLNADLELRLNKADSLTVIAESGEMRVIKGPYRGVLSRSKAKPADNGAIKIAVSRMLATRSDDLSTLGTVRRMGASTEWLKPFASEGWNLISAEHDGVQCVLPGKPLRLMRQEAQFAESAQIRQASGGYQAVQWVANSQHLNWPENLAVAHGGVYLLRRNASSIPYRLEISQLNNNFLEAAPAFQMATLIGRNCLVQATLVQYAAGL